MKASTQFGGVLIVLAVVFALAFAPGDPAIRALLAALAITVGGGTMAFFEAASKQGIGSFNTYPAERKSHRSKLCAE